MARRMGYYKHMAAQRSHSAPREIRGQELKMEHNSPYEYFFFGLGIAVITTMIFFGGW